MTRFGVGGGFWLSTGKEERRPSEREERLAQEAIDGRNGEMERLSALERERSAAATGFEAQQIKSAQASYYPGHHVPAPPPGMAPHPGPAAHPSSPSASPSGHQAPTFARPSAPPPSSYNPMVHDTGDRGFGRMLLLVLFVVAVIGMLATAALLVLRVA